MTKCPKTLEDGLARVFWGGRGFVHLEVVFFQDYKIGEGATGIDAEAALCGLVVAARHWSWGMPYKMSAKTILET